MVTSIGNTSDKIIISDHATPSSGIYAWYLPASSYIGTWGLGPLKGSRETASNGTSTGISTLTIDQVKQFQDIPIVGWTNYQNLQKALAYWSKKDSRLYLSYTPDDFSSNNIAVVARYADVITTGEYEGDVTLSQFTGKLQGYRENKVVAGTIYVNIGMYYEYYAEV